MAVIMSWLQYDCIWSLATMWYSLSKCKWATVSANETGQSNNVVHKDLATM